MPSTTACPSRRSLLTTPLGLLNAAHHLSLPPTSDVPHLSPQFKTSQAIDIRQADLGLGPPVHPQGFGNRRKAQTPQQVLRQLWTVGQQRSDPPAAALQPSTNTISRVSPVATPLGAGAIRGAPANSAGPDPDPPAPGAPAVPPPHPLPLPAR